MASTFTEQFVHLLIMACVDCSEFGEELLVNAIPSLTSNPHVAMIAKRLSTPLSLQEIAIKRVRQSVGAPRLWHKIDSLPLPRQLKEACKLAN